MKRAILFLALGVVVGIFLMALGVPAFLVAPVCMGLGMLAGYSAAMAWIARRFDR